MIDFSEPYTVNWHVYSVDPETWDERDRLNGVISANINRDCTDDAPLIESSSISVDQVHSYRIEDGWYRIVADIIQDARMERIPISTQLYQATGDTIEGFDRIRSLAETSMSTVDLTGRSVLYPASTMRMRDGSYIAKGSNGAKWVESKLRQVIKSPVRIEGDGFSLSRHVVYDSNDSVLSAIWGVLDAGKWYMKINGNGVVTILEKPREPSVIFDSGVIKSILFPSIKRQEDRSGIPNRYIIRDGLREVVLVNDDPNSLTSTVSIGSYIDSEIDDKPYLVTGESIYNYARRKLEEASTISVLYDYQREYYPNVYPLDLLEISMPEKGLDGQFRVNSQKVTLDTGITVSETVSKERKYWRATDHGQFV